MAEPKTEKVAWWRWLRQRHAGKPEVEVSSLPPSERSIVAWVMRQGLAEIVCPDRTKDPTLNRSYREYVPGMRSFAAVPVRYHGAVIACLSVEWRIPRGYSPTTVQRIHQFAELLAPTLTFRRQLNSLDVLAQAFHTSRTSRDSGEPGQGLPSLIGAVHDALSPLATGFLLNLGFRWIWVGANDQGSTMHIGGPNEEANPRERVFALARVRQDERVQLRRQRVISSGVVIGRLFFALTPQCDPDTRPSLVDDYLHRRTVASMLADAAFNLIHTEFNTILSDFQVDLNLTATARKDLWFKHVERATRRAGLLWAVAGISAELEEKFYGPADAVSYFADPSAHPAALDQGRGLIQVLNLGQPLRGAALALTICLQATSCRLWFGLGKWDFGFELDFDSPWKAFLLGLAQAADSALVRIERQLLELRAQTVERVATRVETAGLLMHTLGNDAAALIHGTERLVAMLDSEENRVTQDVRRKVESLNTTAQNFRQMTLAFKSVPSDARARVALIEAVELVRALYDELLPPREIDLLVDVDRSLIVGVPIEVAYIAIVTLVVNSIQAIHQNGRITIQAAKKEDRILCSVQDSGPGISDSVRARLFEPGFSTKSDGTGIGLLLARNSLRRFLGDLELTSSEPGLTSFTITFPR